MTEVEIYDERELTSDMASKEEYDQEAIELLNSLGLEKQLPPSDCGEDRINPYPVPTDDQQKIIRVLFSEISELSRYSVGHIPLRILKELSHCKEKNLFKYYWILHTPPATVQDPILLGSNSADYKYSLMNSLTYCHMIGRWGDALESWADLLPKAKAKAQAIWTEKIKDAKIKMEVLERQVDEGILPPNWSASNFGIVGND